MTKNEVGGATPEPEGTSTGRIPAPHIPPYHQFPMGRVEVMTESPPCALFARGFGKSRYAALLAQSLQGPPKPPPPPPQVWVDELTTRKP